MVVLEQLQGNASGFLESDLLWTGRIRSQDKSFRLDPQLQTGYGANLLAVCITVGYMLATRLHD